MENSTQFPNPLLDFHHRTDAETQPYGAIEVVSTFGQPQVEYAALHKSAGVMDLPFRGVIELTGRDRSMFLNGLISNQTWDKNTKSPMPAGSWVYAFMLNLKGRIVADMNVIELGDVTMVETDIALVQPLMDVFEKYQFAEQVKMQSRVGSLHEMAVLGPEALKVFPELSNLAGGRSAASVTINGVEVIAWRDSPTGSDGAHLIVPTDRAADVWRHIAGESDGDSARRARPVGWAAFNTGRIEAGRALFGIDFAGVSPASAYPQKKLRDAAATDESGPGTLPAETGALFNRAINLSKCYVGQEIVARMYARQQVARQIVGFKMTDDALPLAGAPVLDGAGNQIGIVTSSTVSPIKSNAVIGLATLKKPHFAVGTEVTIPAEGQMRQARVAELPLS
jgi:folate-binding protein YgfZ